MINFHILIPQATCFKIT